MFSHDLPTLEEKMEEAKTILTTNYGKFEELITKNKVKYCSPFWDIACFLIQSEIKGKKVEDKWMEFWERNTKKQLYKNKYYNAPIAYIQFSADEEMKRFFEELLEEKEKEEMLLEWKNYLELFYRVRERSHPTLTRQEYTMLLEMLKNQTLSNTIIKEKTRLDLSNISKYKKQLMEKGILYQGITFNPIKLGLRIYTINLIFPANYMVEIEKIIPNSTFYRYTFENIDNVKTYMVTYLAPEEERTEKYLENLCKKIAEEHPLQQYKIYKVIREKRKITFNYENYNPKTKTWNITKEIMKMIMRKYPSTKKEKVTFETNEFKEKIEEREEKKAEKKKIILTKESLDVFNNLINNNLQAVKQRAEELGISEGEVKKNLNYLYENNIVKERIQCMPIFGQSSILIHIEEKDEKQEELHNFFSIYPEVFTEPYETKESKGILVVIRCPHEDLIETQDIINYRFDGKIELMMVLNQMYAKRLILPAEKYNTLFKKWEFTEEDIIGEGEKREEKNNKGM